MTILTKQQVINNILITMRMIRQLKATIDIINKRIRIQERKARILSESKLNRHLVNELNLLVKQAIEVRTDFLNKRKEKALILSHWITQYDLYKSNDHKKFQLLGISHIDFSKSHGSNNIGNESLRQSAIQHCETLEENEDQSSN